MLGHSSNTGYYSPGSTFSHWYCDVAGPMSSEKMEFPFCVLLLDSMSRYPAAFAIRSPNAKNICDCLIKLWMYFGIPRYVTLDNATCNVAKLTQEFMKRLGVSPRFITPWIPGPCFSQHCQWASGHCSHCQHPRWNICEFRGNFAKSPHYVA